MTTQQVALDVTTDDGYTRTLTVQVEVEGKMPIGELKEARHVFGHEKGSQLTTIISWGHRQTTKPAGTAPVNTVAPVVEVEPG